MQLRGGFETKSGGPPKKSILDEKLRFLLREEEAEGTLGWGWAHREREAMTSVSGKSSAEASGKQILGPSGSAQQGSALKALLSGATMLGGVVSLNQSKRFFQGQSKDVSVSGKKGRSLCVSPILSQISLCSTPMYCLE